MNGGVTRCKSCDLQLDNETQYYDKPGVLCENCFWRVVKAEEVPKKK
jgi:hypothetical protein